MIHPLGLVLVSAFIICLCCRQPVMLATTFTSYSQKPSIMDTGSFQNICYSCYTLYNDTFISCNEGNRRVMNSVREREFIEFFTVCPSDLLTSTCDTKYARSRSDLEARLYGFVNKAKNNTCDHYTIEVLVEKKARLLKTIKKDQWNTFISVVKLSKQFFYLMRTLVTYCKYQVCTIFSVGTIFDFQ